ncbi:MAG: hypothetical protein EXX96DRAFT_588634 [Benjaminiella poitrasii]|nr:MAG: hypothetical protein EXX96DRAFT_588634 [Benjaminiella poitrasii]
MQTNATLVNKDNPSTKTPQYPVQPLERMNVVHDEKTIISQLQNLLSIDDNEIFDDDEEEEDYASLPLSSDSHTYPQPASNLTRSDSLSSEFSRIEYINSIRKTRPLPKIPDRVSSKNMTQNMTALLSESFRNQNRVSAQQLFHLLNKQKSEADKGSTDHDTMNADESKKDDLKKEEDDDEEEEYGGVFALKTQMPSPTLSNKETLEKYYQDMAKDYKMMTPVQEVDEEEQLFEEQQEENDLKKKMNSEEQQEIQTTAPNYVLVPTENDKPRPLSEVSSTAPSLASGRTSPSSHHSFVLRDPSNEQDFEDAPPLTPTYDYNTKPTHHDEQQQTLPDEETKYDTINNISALYANPTDGYRYGAPPTMPTQHHEDTYYENYSHPEASQVSLVSDVHKLSVLNQALMTPQVSNSTLPNQQHPFTSPLSSHGSTLQPSITTSSVNTNEYANVDLRSAESLASFSLTHNKDSLKTYRRMATKTMDRTIQFTYAQYLIRLVSHYAVNTNTVATIERRNRLQEEAEYWIEKLAKTGFAPALYTKGQWHRHCCDTKAVGLFVGSQYKKINHARAFKCFQQAAKQGSVEAYYELAEYYMLRKDYKKTVSCYQYAASRRHVLALYKLANVLMRGLLHQPKNIQQGLVYLRQAADSERPECARSAYDYACILINDLESIGLDRDPSIASFFITQDPVTAIHYLKKADRFGLVDATYRLGQMCLQGENTMHTSVWEAFKYFSRAAEQKHEGAMLELSKLYKDGISGYLSPHPTLAYDWRHRVAEKGNEVAEYMLGLYYDNGIGVYPDHHKACEWYSKSASKGYRPAEEALSIPPSNQRSNHHPNKPNQKYYEESIRIAEDSRTTTVAEQNCQIM